MGDGKHFEQAVELTLAAVEGEGGAIAGAADGDADGKLLLAQQIRRDAGGDGDAVFLGGAIAFAGLGVAIEVEQDGDINGWVEVELLDHELAEAGGGGPVDAG